MTKCLRIVHADPVHPDKHWHRPELVHVPEFSQVREHTAAFNPVLVTIQFHLPRHSTTHVCMSSASGVKMIPPAPPHIFVSSSGLRTVYLAAQPSRIRKYGRVSGGIIYDARYTTRAYRSGQNRLANSSFSTIRLLPLQYKPLHFLSIPTPHPNTPQEHWKKPGCATVVQLFHTALGHRMSASVSSEYLFFHPNHCRSIQDTTYTKIPTVANKETLCRPVYSNKQNTFATMSYVITEVVNEEKLCGHI